VNKRGSYRRSIQQNYRIYDLAAEKAAQTIKIELPSTLKIIKALDDHQPAAS
jgi:hypothetical protein